MCHSLEYVFQRHLRSAATDALPLFTRARLDSPFAGRRALSFVFTAGLGVAIAHRLKCVCVCAFTCRSL